MYLCIKEVIVCLSDVTTNKLQLLQMEERVQEPVDFLYLSWGIVPIFESVEYNSAGLITIQLVITDLAKSFTLRFHDTCEI